MWDALIAAARPGVIDVILNPASGPGVGPIDSNYIRPGGQTGPLLELANSGASILGYVHTQWGGGELTQVLEEIDRYFDVAYYRDSTFLPHGIFVDEMSNDLLHLDYYDAIRQHVYAKSEGIMLVGNPGTASIIDSSQGTLGYTESDYATVFDQLVVFEGNGITYRNQFATPDWIVEQPAQRFAHIVHSDASVEKMKLNVRLAGERNAETLYLTDDIMPNPYDQLPTYWSELLKRVIPPVTIDELSAAIRRGLTSASFDLNDDGSVDQKDRSFWLQNIAQTTFGDSNLDGRFDATDLVSVFQAGEYDDGIAGDSVWATGDWTGDAEFDSADLVLAMQTGDYQFEARRVPEPMGTGGWPLVWLLWVIVRSHDSRGLSCFWPWSSES